MLRLLIIRHGQTSYNLEGRSQGHADIELDEAGLKQAEMCSVALRQESVDAVYSSDMKRTLATAEALSQKIGVEVISDIRLRERDYGSWEGMTREDILERDQEAYRACKADPVLQLSGGGESGIDVFARVGYFLVELLERRSSGTVAIFTHGGSGSALIAALLHGSPATADCFRLSNGGITEITFDEIGTRRMVRFDDCSHLRTSC
ncbi:MAG: histidine phosphatase family protein [Armatimonadetes bacterium]|nr:histidine phosphatase family protein [Armatimonadota bacterium]